MEYKLIVAWWKGRWTQDDTVFVRERVEKEVYKCTTPPPYEILHKYIDENSIVGFEVSPWKKEDENLKYETLINIRGCWLF